MASKPLHLNKGRGRRKYSDNSNSYLNPNSSNYKAKPGLENSGKNFSNGTFSEISNFDKINKIKKGQGDELDNLKSEERFKQASAKIHESVQQILNQEETCESSEEEELDSDNIIATVFKSYSKNSNAGVTRTEQFVLDSFKSGSSGCLICLAGIKRVDAVWSCAGCYCMFHIQCIQKWVKDGAYQTSILSVELFPKKNIFWFCPKCRHQYLQKECPTKYTCFCGKIINPEFDPWLIPHSCGQICKKPLKPDCGHNCLLLCHPGPCPTCPQTITTSCHCKASKPLSVRCSVKEWSCGKPCKKLLGCGQHFCPIPCHSGLCPTCSKQSSQKCFCGREVSLMSCSTPKWHCSKVCNKKLSCGHHRCEIVCHDNSCGPCPRSGIRTCPCGKSEYHLPCIEDIPTCGDTCNKQLDCQVHQCSSRCHTGPCGTCFQMIVKKCRCGSREKSLPCNKEYLCESKCKNLRDCQRHTCNRKCCDGNCPSCEQICGKTLSCRSHKCSSRCHSGLCYPCLVTIDINCFCGSTTITKPCGKTKSTNPPKCKELCKIPPECFHSSSLPHLCHFGQCPPCKQICNKLLPSCKHRCPIRCHTAVLVKHCDEIQRIGPWEPKALTKFEVESQPCPPCQVLVELSCLGNHMVTQLPCSSLKPYSCLKPCDRLLHCLKHRCTLECHQVLNAPDDSLAGSNCSECEEKCSYPRLKSCTHDCSLGCHQLPCPPCKEMIKLRCHCQLKVLLVECNIWNNADDKIKLELTSCKNICPKNLPCGHRCTFVCHSGMCSKLSQCTETVIAYCICKKRKKKIACKAVPSNKKKVIDCDEGCKQFQEQMQKLKEEEEQKKISLELKKQQEELEKAEKKLQNKKRKLRVRGKIKAPTEPFLKPLYIFILLLSILTSFVIYILFLYK